MHHDFADFLTWFSYSPSYKFFHLFTKAIEAVYPLLLCSQNDSLLRMQKTTSSYDISTEPKLVKSRLISQKTDNEDQVNNYTQVSKNLK